MDRVFFSITDKLGKIFLLFISLFLLYTTPAHAFRDKKGREITIEWDTTLTDKDKRISHRSYFSQKKHYEERNINFAEFFEKYNKEIAEELLLEIRFPAQSQEREFHLLRASHADDTVGFAYFKKKNEVGSSFFLEFIALDPEFQGCGIGGGLIFEIGQKFNRLRRLSLDTRVFNTNGQRFYESLAFTAEKGKTGYIHYVRDINRSLSVRTGIVHALPYDLYELQTFGEAGPFIPPQYPFLVPPVVRDGIGLQITKLTKNGDVISGMMTVTDSSLIKQKEDTKSVLQRGESDFEAFLSEFPDKGTARLVTKDFPPLYETVYNELTSRGFTIASSEVINPCYLKPTEMNTAEHQAFRELCHSKTHHIKALEIGVYTSDLPEMGADHSLYAKDIDNREASTHKMTLLPGHLQELMVPPYTYYYAAYMDNVFPFLSQKKAVESLIKVYNLLDTGGCLLATTRSPLFAQPRNDGDSWFLDPLKTRRILEAAGFVNIKIQETSQDLGISAYKPSE